MVVALHCVCLLSYLSFSASKGSGTGKDPSPSDVIEPSPKILTSTSTEYKLPGYISGDDAAAVTKQKKWFHYNNRGPLSAGAKAVMLPKIILAPIRIKNPNATVEALCHVDRMYVRILKNAVNDTRAWRYLYFGNCRVNAAKGPHYYFLYPLTRCGLKPLVLGDTVVFTNLLRYLRKGPDAKEILRNETLTVPVSCRYPRFHRTYDVGIHPILGVNKTLLLPSGGGPAISLVVLDANWNPLGLGAYFRLGQAMHFEIRTSGRQRVFPSRCWFTATSHHNTILSFTVIENYGCLVDSMNSTMSQFHPHVDQSVLRFTIEAFVFSYMAPDQVMSLHCEVRFGNTATLYRKACTYKQPAMWHALDRRNDLLCLCCNGVCPAPPPSARPAKEISSIPWRTGDTTASDDLDEFKAKEDEVEEEIEADLDDEIAGDTMAWDDLDEFKAKEDEVEEEIEADLDDEIAGDWFTVV